jgi:hypothetical protein
MPISAPSAGTPLFSNDMPFKPLPTQSRRCVTPNGHVHYELKRSSRRKTLSLTLRPQGMICVYAPHHCAHGVIDDFVRAKVDWIQRQRSRMVEHSCDQRDREQVFAERYRDGGTFRFLGESVTLKINRLKQHARRPRISIDSTRIHPTVNANDSQGDSPLWVHDQLIKWFRCQAEEYLGGQLFRCVRATGLEPDEIKVKTQKRMWGCCYPKQRRIYLNWQLILLPRSVIDYVLIHELCHLLEANHSPRFWGHVRRHCPDFKIHRLWLKNNQNSFQWLFP